MFTGYTRALQGTRGLNRVDELTVFTGYSRVHEAYRVHEVIVFTGYTRAYRVHEVTVFTGYTRALQGTRGNKVDEATVYRVHGGLNRVHEGLTR